MKTEVAKNADDTYITVSDGKHSAFVVIYGNGQVGVTCHNASHRVFRRSGRMFDSIFQAISGYKSESMKSMIEAAYKAAQEGE